MSSPQKEELEALERILSDPKEDPVKLSYPTIEQMTQEFSNEIGRGSFGVVYLGTLPSGKIAVKKLSNANDYDDKLFMDEINCLIRAKHKNIVRFLGYCADVDNKMIQHKGRYILAETRKRILCFEYVPNGNLYNYLKGEPNKDEWQMRYTMIKEICQGLQCLHGRRINHLDLKPENVLMDTQMRPKISDFGLSRCFDEGQSRLFTENFYGTRGYVPPEFIEKGEISLKSDIFSLGIIIIKLLTGRNNYDIENWDKSLDVDGPEAKRCIEIAQSCTHADQHKRPTVDEVLDKLNVVESMIQESTKDTSSSIKQMDLNILEQMFRDENAEPMNLTLSVLEDITNHFSPDHKIGSGGFAVVYKGTVGKLSVAVKKLTGMHDLQENRFHMEVESLVKARHRNIVRFLGYCAETQRKVEEYEGRFVMADMQNWLLCFEYLPNGSLEKYITDASVGFAWKERFRIIKGICHGLHYLHNKRILHMDLKPANILLDDLMEPKIGDFGLSRFLAEEQTRATTQHLFGTMGYFAPEVFSGRVSFASDVYSLGNIIMEILTGAKGYPEDDTVTKSWMHRLEGANQLEQVRVCTKIGIACMNMDPKKRPVVSRIIDILDRASSIDETGMSSSLVELLVSLRKDQSDQERTGKLAVSVGQEDVKERPGSEDDAEHLGNDRVKESSNNWSSWEAQGTKQNINRKVKGIFGSNSAVLKVWNIFKRDTHKNFVRNGGKVPKIRGLTIFRTKQILKITRNYSEPLHQGVSATIYRGTLPDNTMVEVKIFHRTDTYEEFAKGVEIQAHMIHKNILKLVGYCVEADVPILVYEYASNGSLTDILHGDKKKMLDMDLRLDIAIGSAEGLRYMHCGDLRHGDVKSASIFVDEKFIPKISEFELSKYIDVDGFETGTINGSMGYLDPVFVQTSHLTLKSDVYAFGAVLLELITGMKIIYSVDQSRPRNLVNEYQKCYEKEKNGRAMFAKEIAAEEDIFVLEEIGKLAMECLSNDIEERPDIMVVTDRLTKLKKDRRLGKAHNAS